MEKGSSAAAMDMESQPLLPAAGFDVSAKAGKREWRGKWWHIFGDCSGQDVAACCLAWKFPCVAWGWNQQRGLQFSFIRELIRYVLLSAGMGVGLYVGGFLIMATLCPQAMPPHIFEHPDALAAPRIGSKADGVDAEHPSLPQECVQSVSIAYMVLYVVALAALICLWMVLFRRRTAIRERFGIKGTTTDDAVLYCCCTPCALAQETRTLMHQQVHNGVWYGALPGVQAPTASAAPAFQKMGC